MYSSSSAARARAASALSAQSKRASSTFDVVSAVFERSGSTVMPFKNSSTVSFRIWACDFFLGFNSQGGRLSITYATGGCASWDFVMPRRAMTASTLERDNSSWISVSILRSTDSGICDSRYAAIPDRNEGVPC